MPEADPDEEAGPGAPSAVPRLPQALALTCEDRRPWGTAINGALMPPTVFWNLARRTQAPTKRFGRKWLVPSPA
jgi:hypothetical protein